MKKLWLLIRWIIYLAITGLIVLVIGVTWGDQIKLVWAQITWKIPTSIQNVKYGSFKSDVIFQLGTPKKCFPDTTDTSAEYCVWTAPYDENKFTGIHFKGNSVNYISQNGAVYDFDFIPFRHTKEMHIILGQENIYTESADYLERRYTYLSSDGKTGATFDFKNDNITGFNIGNVTWRKLDGKYVINGKILCPSPACPFDKDGKLMPKHKDKTVWSYIQQN